MTTLPVRLSSNIRRTLANYFTALAINVGILTGPSRATERASVPEILLVQERILVDGCWHPGEVVTGNHRRLVLTTLAEEPSDAARRVIISKN